MTKTTAAERVFLSRTEAVIEKKRARAAYYEQHNGETEKVIVRIRDLEKQNPAIEDRIETEVGYFQKHHHHMQYWTLNEKGYQIGSGVIESACRYVVNERCKQAGMRWGPPGINAILFWRSLLKNDASETY